MRGRLSKFQLTSQERVLPLGPQPGSLRGLGDLDDRGGGAPAPDAMRLGSSQVKLPDRRDTAARQQSQRKILGMGFGGGHSHSGLSSSGCALSGARKAAGRIEGAGRCKHNRTEVTARSTMAPSVSKTAISFGEVIGMPGTILGGL